MRDNLHLLFRVFSTTSQQTLQQQFSGRRYFGDGVLSRNWIKGSVQYPATDGYPALANESSIIHRLDRLFACACKTARWTCFVFFCFFFVARWMYSWLDWIRQTCRVPKSVSYEKGVTIDVSSTSERENIPTEDNKWTLPKDSSKCYIPHYFRSRVAPNLHFDLTTFYFKKWHIPWLTFDWLAP